MLQRAVNTYLAVRRAASFELKTVEYYLRDFTRFAVARGDTHVVAQTAIAWAAQAMSEAQRHNRLMTLLRFARFMHAEDPRHELPPDDIFCGRRQRPTPYIFRQEEIQRIVAQARQLGPSGSLRPATYSTLFGLLAATGMRASEARALHCRDMTSDGLMIRESKFKKSRIVPLHDTTRDVLEHYLDRRCRQAGYDPHLFVSLRHGKLSRTAVAETFHHVLNRSSGFMLLLVRLWDVSPSRFASGLRNDAPRADCAPAPPRRALCGHAPSRGSKSDVSPDVL